MTPPSLRAQSRRGRLRNLLQELVLGVVMAGVMGAVAWFWLGYLGMATVLLSVVTLAALRPRVSAGLVLWLYGAQPLSRWAAPRLHQVVDVLARRAELPRPPAIYYVPSPVANSFVVGEEDDAALAVTDGLLRRLSGREVAGVVAHEISHLRHHDARIMTLSDAVARIAQWMAWIGVWSTFVTVPRLLVRGETRPVLVTVSLVLVPMVVTLAQLALSRSREYDADLMAAVLTGDPEGLASALVVLERAEGRLWERLMVGRSPRPDPVLLRTHPATERRVERLLALKVGQDGPALHAPHPVVPVGYPPVTRGPRLRRTGVRWLRQ